MFALIVSFYSLLGGHAVPSTGIFQIVGYIRNSTSNAVAGIEVSVDDYVGDVYTGVSDGDGFYLVEVDSDSNYRVVLNCAQLTGRGYVCPAPVALTVNDGGLELDFTVEAANSTLQVTNTFLPRGIVGVDYSAQLGASGGKAPYTWLLAPGSASLPPGFLLNAAGLISGQPTTNYASAINVQVTDANSFSTNQVLSLAINPRPILSAMAWSTNHFLIWIAGATNQDYAIQSASDLNTTNWTTLLFTNGGSTNSFMVADPIATNGQRFYRVLIGP